MYEFYINGILLPVTPAKLEIKSKGKNKAVTLINEGEVNMIKSTGLQEISFEALLPNQKYPFARYPDGFQTADYYVDALQGLINSGQPFQFIVVRHSGSGFNFRVTLEDMTLKDDTKNGTDQTVSIKLKEYRDYGTKIVELVIDQRIAVVEETRQADNAPQVEGSTYTVQKGDSLWKIAKHFYGNGNDYKKIADTNAGTVKNPNQIYPGQILMIP